LRTAKLQSNAPGIFSEECSQMKLKALAAILFLGTLWGTSILAVRFMVNGTTHPFTFSAMRLIGAASLYLLVGLLRIGGKHFPTGYRLWKFGILMGVADSAIFVLFATSISYLSSGVASIMPTLTPVITVLLAHLILKDERLNFWKAIGIASSFSGVLLMAALRESGLPNTALANPLGYILGIGGATLTAFMTVLARRKMVHFEAFSLTSVRFFVAAVVTTIFASLTVGMNFDHFTTQEYLILGYSSLIFFVGFFVAFKVIQKYGATVNALSEYITPIVATTGGVILFGEHITHGMLAGLAMIAFGLVLINRNVGLEKTTYIPLAEGSLTDLVSVNESGNDKN